MRRTVDSMQLRIHADFGGIGLLYDLLYDLLSRSQRPSRGTLFNHTLARINDRHLRDRVRHGLFLHLHISNIDLNDRSRSLSSLSGSFSSSPSKNLFDQTQDDGNSNRGEEGRVNSEFMFIRLLCQLIHSWA
jgi:hypothetical protein